MLLLVVRVKNFPRGYKIDTNPTPCYILRMEQANSTLTSHPQPPASNPTPDLPPDVFWPITPKDLFEKVAIPSGLHEPITRAFDTNLFSEEFTKFHDLYSSWSETRELFWKRYRRSAGFRLMTIVQENKSKKEFVFLLYTQPEFSIFLFTPTKTSSERAEDRLQELLALDLVTDDGLQKDIVKVLSSLAKDRESGYVDESKLDKDPFEGMPQEVISLLRKAARSG